MPTTICFVVGLPGSGKSIYLEQLQKSGVLTINNPTDFEKDILPHLSTQEQVLAIADYNLCLPAFREKTVIKIGSLVPNVAFRWIYFENDPVQCLSNLRLGGVRIGAEPNENLVWQISQGYSIPTNIETRPVVPIEEWLHPAWLSYAPSTKSEKAYKLIRVVDDLVIFSSSEWEKFRPVVMFILQKYPTHRFSVVEEVITRSVTDMGFDRLIGEKK
jgi:hypothetical protein